MKNKSFYKTVNILIAILASFISLGCMVYELVRTKNGGQWGLFSLTLLLAALLWTISPYIFLLILFYKGRVLSWILGLFCTIITTILTVFGLRELILTSIIYPPDAQSILVVVYIPLIQWVGCLVVLFLLKSKYNNPT